MRRVLRAVKKRIAAVETIHVRSVLSHCQDDKHVSVGSLLCRLLFCTRMLRCSLSVIFCVDNVLYPHCFCWDWQPARTVRQGRFWVTAINAESLKNRAVRETAAKILAAIWIPVLDWAVVKRA